MKNLTFIFILSGLLFSFTPIRADVPDTLRAKETAVRFLNERSISKGGLSAEALSLTYLSPDTAKNMVYLFNNALGGFVMVAQSEDRMVVTGYSTRNKVDIEQSSSALHSVLNFYETTRILEQPIKGQTKIAVTPLLDRDTIQWNQTLYYNQSCPYDEDAGGYTYAGCVAVAMGQIMRYHKHPETGRGSHSYTHFKYGELSVDYSAATYKWDSMPGMLTSENKHVADLLYHCGVAVNTEYTPDYTGSGGNSRMAATAFNDYFQYPDAAFMQEDNFATVEEYYATLRNEIDSARPVFYVLRGDPGHAVVCDGYDGDYFHINFGWSGNENGYFLLSGVVDISIYKFGFLGDAITGISPVSKPCNKSDSLALVALYNSTDGANWTRNNNWLTGRVKDWYGVDVVDGRVVHVLLYGNNLSRSIPAAIGDLDKLTSLNLSSNQLTGDIPEELGDLRNLLRLTLSSNQLTGSLPAGVGQNTGMVSLNLDYNQFDGEIPEQIGQLTNLKYLTLQNNNFSGTIPPGIINMSDLANLNVSYNNLSGNLPEDIGNLSGLHEFLIDHNQFTGTLPQSIINMTELRAFNISNNQFEGALPAAVGSFDFLSYLELDNNNFTSLPAEIGQLQNLTILSAYNNQLDSLPAEIGQLTKLNVLDLSGNELTTLPPEIGNLTNLKGLRLDHNRLTNLPAEIGNLVHLNGLPLNNNQLVELPYEISKLQNLQILEVNSNKLRSLNRSISNLKSVSVIEADSNLIASALPELGHLDVREVFLRNNNLVFSDLGPSGLPDDTDWDDGYSFFYLDQQQVPLSEQTFRLHEEDTLYLDITQISRLSHPGNEYVWYRNGSEYSSGPVLRLGKDASSDSSWFHCKVTNPNYTRLQLATDSIYVVRSIRSGTERNPLVSGFIPSNTAADDTVVLMQPEGLRGEVYWEASVDSVNWEKITGSDVSSPLAKNVLEATDRMVTIRPDTAAVYRYVVQEENCPPLYSDTIFVPRWSSQMLVDTMINVAAEDAVVVAPGIELIVPKGLASGEFRLTIEKVINAPAAPDSLLLGPVYDVNLSCGDRFDRNILVKIYPDEVNLLPENVERFAAVYYDEDTGQWTEYENGNFSLKDSCFVFETDHLTKLSYWEKLMNGGFDYKFVKNQVTVYYKSSLLALAPLYDKNQSAQPYYVPSGDPEYGTPWMVQDAAHYTEEVMTAFKKLNLEVPEEISVYIDLIDGYGEVGLMAMLNGYLTISQNIENPELLRSVIAHEYMHYTQDYYISAHAGNLFWMEANGHTADRMVWDSTVIPVSESERYLLDGRSNPKASIFTSLSNSWDYWDRNIVTQNVSGNMDYCYLAGCFIHYMRSNRKGAKLSPASLLKETSLTGTWKNYLNGYIMNHLQSDIGEEFHQYVRYIFSGENLDFSLLNHTGDPFKYLHQAPVEFLHKTLINFSEEEEELPVEDKKMKVNLPHLSAKAEQFYNMTANRSVCVRYKRLHTDTASIKVYLAIWDDDQKKMKMTDISQIDSSFFFIEAATEENVDKRKNQAYILLINEHKDEVKSADYELEITPVPDFSFIYFLHLSREDNYNTALIHKMSDGTFTSLGLQFTYDSYTVQQKIITDSTIEVTVQGTGENSVTTMTTRYNFRKGNMTVNRNYRYNGSSHYTENNTRYILKDIFLDPNDAASISQGAGTFVFVTSTTAGTRSKIVEVDGDIYREDYDNAGSVTSTESLHYVGTEWPADTEIRMKISVK